MTFFAEGGTNTTISPARISELIDTMLGKLGKMERVLLLPPDYTRYHSFAGAITCMLYEKLKTHSNIEILPTIGTHSPLTRIELDMMYPGIPYGLFKNHDWKKDVVRLGTVPRETVGKLTGGLASWHIHCEINRILVDKNWDQIISVGQLVPHELAGIGNYDKNILIGAGGKDIIGKTHMIGALFGLERSIGHIHTPVRKVLNYMSQHFIHQLPVCYVLTVRDIDREDLIVTRGIFAGNDDTCFLQGAKLCQKVNITPLNREYNKVITYLDPEVYKSTWVGNKAIFRTGMAVANGGELIILCPGIRTFGEDPSNDAFIRKYGYLEREPLLRAIEKNGDMENNLTPLSHMIISSPENRFRVTYATEKTFKPDLESVHCHYADYEEVVKRYDPSILKEGENIMPDGEEVYYVSKPAQGLWTQINEFLKYERND